MAYLGTSPLTGKFQKLDDISSGFNDSQTTFTLQSSGVNVEPGSPQQLLVSIDGVLQEPVGAFTLTGSTITFSEAPNTNATFFAILLGETGIVNTINDGVIDSAKLQANAVIHTKLAADAVGTPQIKDGEVTQAKLTSGTFPVNAANIATDAVETAKILDDAVTSPKIAPIVNLQEDILITASAALANTTINVLENSIRYFTGDSSSNICINIRGDDSTLLNSVLQTGNTITTALIVTNGSTAYFTDNTQVDNVAVVPKVQGGSALTSGNANSTDLYTITVLKTADATFTMFLTQTQFA